MSEHRIGLWDALAGEWVWVSKAWDSFVFPFVPTPQYAPKPVG